MNKLMSYGITARALQLLTGSAELPDEIPQGWFNWTGQKPETENGYAPRRIELVNFDDNCKAIACWNANAHAAGYACTLVAAMDEGCFWGDIPGLRGDVICVGVTDSSKDEESNNVLLPELREPEQIILTYWSALRLGGGGNFDETGLSLLKPEQWFAYGNEFESWVDRTAEGKPDASMLRKHAPDYSYWNPWKDVSGCNKEPAVKLSLKESWMAPKKKVFPWSLDNPCTVSDIPSLADHGYIAYYPMRQMPCCGIAIDNEGKLHTIGALPTEPDGSWEFDDGSIRQAFEQKAQELPAMV